MVEPKIGALHVWLRASILSFSCLTSLHWVMLCNHVWHTKISLTNAVYSETGFWTWCSRQEFCVFTVYCSWKGFICWKPSSEESFCQLILMRRAGGGILFKDSQGKKSRALGKGWYREGVCEEREGGPCRAVVSHANPVPPACLAKWKCSSSLPKNVMWQHTDIPLFLAAKAARSSVLSFLTEARLLDCSAMRMKGCVLMKAEVRLFRG